MEEKELFDKYLEGEHWKKHPTVYADRFVKFLKSQSFVGTLVDIGCGNGRDVDYFNNNEIFAKGIDFDEKEIINCKKHFSQYSFLFDNIEALSLPDESIDAFFCINVIHYVQKKKALDEIYRCLKKRGFLFIHFNQSIIDIEGKSDYYHSKKDILNLIQKFSIVKQKEFERVDKKPKEHTHKILEFILQKV